jgi:rhamnosyltransferase
MASSGIRKNVWARRGFNERLQYSEDDEYTRWCRAQGYRVSYVPESIAMHSHNYTPAQAYRRSFGEACVCFCARSHRLDEWPHALLIRWQQRRSRLAGFRAGWAAYRENHPKDAVHPPVWSEGKPAIQS